MTNLIKIVIIVLKVFFNLTGSNSVMNTINKLHRKCLSIKIIRNKILSNSTKEGLLNTIDYIVDKSGNVDIDVAKCVMEYINRNSLHRQQLIRYYPQYIAQIKKTNHSMFYKVSIIDNWNNLSLKYYTKDISKTNNNYIYCKYGIDIDNMYSINDLKRFKSKRIYARSIFGKRKRQFRNGALCYSA